jgi:hypothetical protein
MSLMTRDTTSPMLQIILLIRFLSWTGSSYRFGHLYVVWSQKTFGVGEETIIEMEEEDEIPMTECEGSVIFFFHYDAQRQK